MKKYLRRDFKLTLLQGLIAIFLTALIVTFFGIPYLRMVESFLITMGVSFFFSIIIFAIGTKFRLQGMYKGIHKEYIDDNNAYTITTSKTDSNALEEYFSEQLKNGKQVKAIKVIFRFTILFIAIFIFFIIWDFVFDYLVTKIILPMLPLPDIENVERAKSAGFIEGVCLAKIVYQIVFVLRRTCKKCGCFYSFVEYDSKTSSFSSKEHRTVDRNVKVGEIRTKSSDQKVGDVYKTVQDNQSRMVSGSATTYYYKCAYCNNTTEEEIVTSYSTKWR